MTIRFDAGGPERFRDIVAASFGLAFDDGKLAFLGDLLKRRAEAHKVPVEIYLGRLEGGALRDEAGPLAEALTVGETYFFRNGDQFRAFNEVVLPERMKARAGSRQLRFLSAGCSSGEEPFSLAIIVKEAIAAQPWTTLIQAVDINPAALERAASGRFSNWALRDTPPAIQQRWFRPQGRDLALSDEIRTAVQFTRRNLAVDDEQLWAAEAYDAIFCRNVIMYFPPAVQQAVIARITRALAPGGYLFLGHAETLRGLSHDFHLVHTHGTFYYQRKRKGDAAAPATYSERPPPTVLRTVPLPAAAPPDTGWFEAIGSATKRIEALTTAPTGTAPPPIRPAWNLGATLDLLQRERFGEALDAIRGMPAEAHVDPDVLLLQAVLLVHGGQLAAAAETCRRLLGSDEMNAGANYVLALCFEGAGDRAAATHHYRVASYLDPDFAMPRLHLGLLARRTGDRDAARAELEEALTLLRREEVARILLFGGGFTRDGLIALCEAELRANGARL